jgi:hypothetical protein
MEKKNRFNFWIGLATGSLDIISLIRLAFV